MTLSGKIHNQTIGTTGNLINSVSSLSFQNKGRSRLVSMSARHPPRPNGCFSAALAQEATNHHQRTRDTHITTGMGLSRFSCLPTTSGKDYPIKSPLQTAALSPQSSPMRVGSAVIRNVTLVQYLRPKLSPVGNAAESGVGELHAASRISSQVFCSKNTPPPCSVCTALG